MSSAAKRQVIQRLHDMGFSDGDIRSAITECGYNVESCADWIVSSRQHSKPRLLVGMEVWIFSPEDNQWCPGNIVSITKQLISIIFNGHDFRWLEKESDLYKIQDSKPQNIMNLENNLNEQPPLNENNMNEPQQREQAQNGYNDIMGTNQYTQCLPDETDYLVTFTESVLGLELYSDEDGFNCIVGRCVSTIARSKVTPGSQIVQVNDRWLANYRFEEIRDAVKQAARQPPLSVTFRIKKNLQQKTRNKEIEQPQSIPVENKEEEKQPQNTQIPEDDFLGSLDFVKCSELHIGDHIDHRDDVGRFLLATIVDKSSVDCRVKIHYEGWNSKWDTWCDYKSETHRFAAPRSISRRPNTRFRDLKIRDYVDINPIQRHRGWRVGQIRRMDKYSGQAQIVYKEDGQEFLYWAHLNNPSEIAPFMTRAAETIALQQKIAEFEEKEINKEQQDEEPMNGNNNNDINQNKEKFKFMSPPKAPTVTTATDHSAGYNSAIPSNINNLQYNSYNNPEQQLFNLPNNQNMNNSIQPPPANNMDANGQNMQNMPNMQNMQNMQSMQSMQNMKHQKSRSRQILPRTIKGRPLPPKPTKHKQKKKEFNRSRTQPLPDNNMQHQNIQKFKVNNHQTTNFGDLNFNVPQIQQQHNNHPQTTQNFTHGKTTYTAQW